MAGNFDFHAVAWEDRAGGRHDGLPANNQLNDVYGFLVHAYDTHTREDHHFWVFTGGPADSWDQWVDWIQDNMEDHGMAFA